MDERELQEIEAMVAEGGVLPGDVGRLIAEVRSLIAEVRRLRARAVPKVVWHPTMSGFEALVGALDLKVTRILRGRLPYNWEVGCGESELQTGEAPNESAAQTACEAALLRLVGVQNG